MKKIRFTLFILLCIPLVSVSTAQLSNTSVEKPIDGRIITIDEFIQLATNNDTEFEEILIDELKLRYEKDLQLPARDLVLDVKAQYDFFVDKSRSDPELNVGLEKLFPQTGTEAVVEYKAIPSFLSNDISSAFKFTLAQSIAENAFGRSYRLQDKIVGLEIDVARHQIIEAYEDYLATVMVVYFEWYEAYENLKVGESSYQENLKLLENIKERQKSSIALDIDVNKTHLLVLAKEETYIELTDKYEKALNTVKRIIRYAGEEDLVPMRSDLYDDRKANFDEEFPKFKTKSRTYGILNMLEEKSKFDVDKNADDLLPSIDLLIGYEVRGQEIGVRDEDSLIFAGLAFEWPFPDQVERAEYETSLIDRDKTQLNTINTHYRLYTNIKNLSLSIHRENDLHKIAGTKLTLAISVLEDETENYSFGKVTLNDYIDAVNVHDKNRFNKILHDVQRKKLMVEWLRITDQLVTRKEIETKHKNK